MLMQRKILAGLLFLLVAVFFSSCPTADGPAYTRIVIETYNPDGIGKANTDTTLRFYDTSGNQLDLNDNVGDIGSNPFYPYARIDHTAGLEPGTYYIRINSDAANPGPYMLRVLSLNVGEALPAYAFPGPTAGEAPPDGDDTAVGNVPVAPVDISLGSASGLNRWIDPGTDVDWCKLVLP
jgi:hypothetical protein